MTEFRAAIWAAVSSKPQYRNDSTTSQIEDARAVIRQRGWSESRLYEVPGHTRAYITLMELHPYTVVILPLDKPRAMCYNRDNV